ncbi:MAG: bacteriophage CI repressor [Betaproteobacteria bacterium]|nr:MAG: bacteriophage CI repressor [Betaproteobacteria bacterium]
MRKARMARHAPATSWQKCNTQDLARTDAAGALRGVRMTLGERLKLVRGATSQKAFAAELRIHENTVSNAERRDSATQEYLLKLAEARNINLHWLLTGHGPMRVGESDTSLLQEKISLALADALRAAYGARYATLPVETRARAMRAGANYLRAIGVTERTLPDTEALAKLIRLTIDVMRQAG